MERGKKTKREAREAEKRKEKKKVEAVGHSEIAGAKR